VRPETGLGRHLPDVEAALADLECGDVTGRVWRHDHTVWKPDPAEITNRLGWLSITGPMREQVPALQAFAREVREAGFRDAVVLGMGGSSLGPEVLRQTFGSTPGHPRLTVLDSVVPAWVRSVAESIDPARTLFVISSKSGTTAEPNFLYRYFRAVVESAVGGGRAGGHFAAVTDPGTALADLAAEQGFRQMFLNPTDIGGRYSVLSCFGLVPAALAGIDIGKLLDRADAMREECAPNVPARQSPGARLGAAMGALAARGRDKLTILASPAISSFGLWAEQLVAESTGKEGKGIVPIAGEPLLKPESYGDDRLFVSLRLEEDDNGALDAAMEDHKGSGQPALVLPLRDKYDLGAEFFRWELATAVAGAILGVNPFDQPNVQEAKDATVRVLREYRDSGRLPRVDTERTPGDLLTGATGGRYLAIMAYIRQTAEVDDALAELRRDLGERCSIPTTVGYGPRFLHSTGQLHKGGPDTGLFLQITAEHEHDIAIPGEPYTFGVVADAQALGDLQALQALGRRAARVHLQRADGAAIAALAGAM